MKCRIALILKEHYRKLFQEMKENTPRDVELEFFSYHTNEELKERYQQIKGNFDAFYVSGLIPLQILKNLDRGAERPLMANAEIDVQNTYRLMLKRLFTSKKTDISRIGLDFLRFEDSLEKVIEEDRLIEVVRGYERRWKEFDTEEEIDKEEQAVSDFYQRQIQEGKIDFIITYFYSAKERAEKCGVEACYVYPDMSAFRHSMEDLRKSVILRGLKMSLPAAVYIDVREAAASSEKTEKEIREGFLHLGEELNRKYYNKLVVRDKGDYVEYYTDGEIARDMTKGFRLCPLYEKMERELDFHGCIGYGVGKNIYQARVNAMDAERYGRNGGSKSGGSFLLDERQDLTVLEIKSRGPEKQPVTVSEEYVRRIADQLHLSAETIVRILGVMDSLNTREVTSHDLVRCLGVSLRSANKFLGRLEEFQKARVVGKKRDGNKGRPINIYRIEL